MSDALQNHLTINPELVTDILCRFIRAEIHRAGFQRAVFGLSGGIDSSVVAFLCAGRLGRKMFWRSRCLTRRRAKPRGAIAKP